MPDIKPVISIKNVEKSYYGNKVLKGVSLDVMPGKSMPCVGKTAPENPH